MQNELNCNQVVALMSFYENDKINFKLKAYIDEHLKKCSKCREVYMQSKKIAAHILSLASKDTSNEGFMTKQYEEFKDKLSAYVDNELDDNENIKIKKIAISNPLARKDLEDIYTFKKMLHDSFDKTKNELKMDYSKLVINQITNKKTKLDYSKKFWFAFTGLITLLVISLISILYS